MIKGKYIGSEKPAPWSYLFTKLGIDVFILGPLFIAYGVLWFVFIYALQTSQSWAYTFAIALSIITLWYVPFGAIIAGIVLIVLVFYKQKLGL